MPETHIIYLSERMKSLILDYFQIAEVREGQNLLNTELFWS